MSREPFIIAITGTKGKTTITRILDQLIRLHPRHGHRLFLRVDSDGHAVNGEYRSTNADSVALRQAASTVCPGKYLYELRGRTKEGVAILETSIGSSSFIGTGFLLNHGGIFHSVYQDHLGVRLKTQKTLARHKAYLVFSRLREWDGQLPFAAYNAHDARVVWATKLRLAQVCEPLQQIVYGIWGKRMYLDLAAHIKNGGVGIFYHPDQDLFIFHDAKGEHALGPFLPVSWSLQGLHAPTTLAAVAAVAGYVGYAGVSAAAAKVAVRALQQVRPIANGMRMEHFRHRKTGATVIVDYAHEQYSLKELARYARALLQKNGKQGRLLAVVRFDPVRVDSLLASYGRACAYLFDEVFVYDKIATQKDYQTFRNKKWRRDAPGATARIVYQALQKAMQSPRATVKEAHCVLSEKQALKKALSRLTADDILLFIPKNRESLKDLARFDITP